MPGKSASWRHLALLDFIEVCMHYTQFNGQKPQNDACCVAACSSYEFQELLTLTFAGKIPEATGRSGCQTEEGGALHWKLDIMFTVIIGLIAGRSMLQGVLDIPWQILTPLYFEGSRASRATAGRSYSHQWTSGPLCQPTLMPPHFADAQKVWKQAEFFNVFL